LSPGSELENHFENGLLWLEKVYVDTDSKRDKILQAIRQAEGSATANLDLITDDIMHMTCGED